MFVVAPVVLQIVDVEKPGDRVKAWPVVFEDADSGRNSGVITNRDSREAAQTLADNLNKALADTSTPS